MDCPIFVASLLALVCICQAGHVVRGQFSTKPEAYHNFAQWNFNKMILCVTGNMGYDYLDYGCCCNQDLFCKGAPMDDIDDCCKDHTRCYLNAMQDGRCSHTNDVYSTKYFWTCSAPGHAFCDHANQNTDCGQSLCMCDLAASECYAMFKFPANHALNCDA